MKINIENIFYSLGSEKRFDRTLDLSTDESSGSPSFHEPAYVKGIFCNRSGVVTLEIQVKTEIECICDRCLEPFIKTVSNKFHHVLTMSEQNQNDILVNDDGIIDVVKLVREDILLEQPSKLLCSESCNGLCMKCGCNLNDVSCQCEQQI